MPYEWTPIKVAEWTPDQPKLEGPGFITVDNCVASLNSYKPFTSTLAFSVTTPTAQDDFIRGGVSAVDRDNNTHIYVGDASDLYELSATGWDNVSRSATGAYSGTATTESWRYEQWGNQIVATNYNNVVQRMEMGSATFTDLPGNPPRARHIKRVRDFLVLGNLIDSDSINHPSRLRWCGFNNNETWVPSVKTQSDFQDMLGGGAITGMIGGQYGVIFQTDQISLMTYIGPPLIFRFDTVEQERGCKVPGSIVRYGEKMYYLGDDDFYEFTPQGSRPLGAERWAKFFYREFQQTDTSRVSANADLTQKRILWSYPNKDAPDAVPNRTLCYDLASNRFTYIREGYTKLFAAFGSGFTLEQLNTLSSSIDALTLSLDDPFYAGGRPKLGTFVEESDSWKLAFFEGDPLTARVDTMELRAAPGRS
jgi:hypothetical protein